ncbi:class I tRNA ligase family protein [bacterium]|nr:class I tRNA ligase family protein [bacterium]
MEEKNSENKENIEKNEIAEKEEEILKFWEDNGIFKKSDQKEAPNGEYIFYEGPPTANGKPGIHHMEARAFKDAIPRYKTMQGFHVRRKAGWDTHGLPVEIAVEKELELHSKKDIEEYGIAEFNKKCKESVWKHVDEWEKFTDRIGFWIDYENPYITYEPEYMESVWNVVKKVNDQKLLYKDYRIVNWCPRCGTGLSSHELAQGYKDVHDMSVYVKFKVVSKENTYLLAWTTTPWTLPGNVALAVGEKIKYKMLKSDNENFIVAEDRVEDVMKGKDYEVIEDLKSKDVVGLEYEPLYPYLKDTLPESESKKLKNAYKVYSADFVNTEDGTGIVHTAVMYGADDFVLGTEKDLPKHHIVNESGRFVEGTGFLEGKKVRGANDEIIKDLGDKVFKSERIKHTYPHCWRCNTALLYYARDSWYIRMSDLRDKLVKENSTINWEPEHIKEGRFGEWLREVKDWAISRERYWATPLPVWQNESGDNTVIGSVEELKKYTKKSGNKYFVMRHGEAEHNVKNILSSKVDNPHHVTEKGIEDTKKASKELKNKKIDFVFASPLVRTKETAEIVSNELGIGIKDIIYDERIKEHDFGDLDGKDHKTYSKMVSSLKDKFTTAPSNGENILQVKNRMMDFISEIDKKYENKNILIVTHEHPAWLLFAGSKGADIDTSVRMHDSLEEIDGNLATAGIEELFYTPLPHNENYELDLHRPYIDEIELVDEKGNKLTRVKEVMDVWFDSGAMPFAQDHYPFENKELVEGKGYPADFISEAIDQTRGWFYTLHAIGALMGKGKAYKNVISLGHILDSKGKKMSKSVGNVVDPWEMTDKYGVDALRFWMYTVNQPGDSKNFEERSVDEVVKKVFNLLTNIVKFYELYRTSGQVMDDKHLKSENVLDKWMLTKLNKLIEDNTKHMDEYHLFEPAREIREFIAGFSQWYIRRSRDRFKMESEDRENALATTRYVLLELSKLMAPFTPFIAEQVYQKVRGIDMEESVHLVEWPKADKYEKKLLDDMVEVRKIVSLGLEARSSVNIKVRQPLQTLKVKDEGKKLGTDLLQLIKDEINVKEVVFDESMEEGVELDTNLTQELKEEGAVREITRAIQSKRKDAKLTPQDFINLNVEANDIGKEFIAKFADAIKTGALIKEINFVNVDDEEIKVDPYKFKFKVEK